MLSDCRIMLSGNLEMIQNDPINNSIFTKRRVAESINGKNCVTFTYCNKFGKICTNKGVVYGHCSRYSRCLEFDGVSTCNMEWVHKKFAPSHLCSNTVEIKNQKTLKNYQSISNRKYESQEENEDKLTISRMFNTLLSTCHISIKSASSSVFWDFIYFCMSSYKKYDYYENPRDFIPIPPANNVSQNIARDGFEKLESKLRQFANHYCSIQVDGYQKRSKKIKAFTVSFPQYGGKNEVIKLKDINNSQQSFAEVGAEVFDYCYSLKLHVSTINCDGYGLFYVVIFEIDVIFLLVSQCNAFSLGKENNYTKYLKKKQDVKIYNSRCTNHQINQCVDDLLKSLNWIQKIELTIIDHIHTINKAENFRKSMHGRGNTNYNTRWYWRIEAYDYLSNNYRCYKKIFGNNSISVVDLQCYGLLFEPLMGLHRLCEMNTSSLPMMFSFDLQFFEYIEKLLGLTNIKIFKFVSFIRTFPRNTFRKVERCSMDTC
jgi:hypothetical protein